MLVSTTVLALLPLLVASSTSASPPPPVTGPDSVRHSYSQYLQAANYAPYVPPAEYAAAHTHQHGSHHNAGKYGFENPELAAKYADKYPGHMSALAAGGEEVLSPTWLEEMALMEASSADNAKHADPTVPPTFPSWEGAYYGIRTFAHTTPVRCMTEDADVKYDVAILGTPFDTATSWRPGARFGPNGIRNAAQRLGGANRLLNVNPFQVLKVVDCGDSRMSFYSNDVALAQLEKDYKTLLHREVATAFKPEQKSLALDGQHHPRVFMLGGDHTIVLPALRGLAPIYGPITVIHFDSHCDSRHPRGDPLTHGDYFYFAAQEGLLANNSIHAGIRVTCDDVTDHQVGFITIVADSIEDYGWQGVVERIKARVGDSPVYITIDIDTLDPAFAPATGTPEIGGWTTREMKKILHGLKDLRVIGGDLVELATDYDNQAQITGLASAGLAFEVISMMALQPLVHRS